MMYQKPVDLFCEDCFEILKNFESNSIDSIVTDPPYGISFMNKKWDYDIPSIEIWKECLRVLKPGGHMLAFGGTRTYHRLVINIEDAGFEIMDQLQWIFGSGFPKGQHLLKPANEPICLSRKPYVGSINENFELYSTGKLNIDDSRIFTIDNIKDIKKQIGNNNIGTFITNSDMIYHQNENGRWPSNVLFSHHPDCEFLGHKKIKNTSGSLTGNEHALPAKNVYSKFNDRGSFIKHGDSDGFETIEDWKCVKNCPVKLLYNKSRFFYCSKAEKKDRDDGLIASRSQFKHGMLLSDLRNKDIVGNNHPTVKPTDLMRYLCRLVTPKGGTILDPFMGTGSTGRGAVLEGFDFIGIEKEDDSFQLAKSRIDAAMRKRQLRLFDDIDV